MHTETVPVAALGSTEQVSAGWYELTESWPSQCSPSHVRRPVCRSSEIFCTGAVLVYPIQGWSEVCSLPSASFHLTLFSQSGLDSSAITWGSMATRSVPRMSAVVSLCNDKPPARAAEGAYFWLVPPRPVTQREIHEAGPRRPGGKGASVEQALEPTALLVHGGRVLAHVRHPGAGADFDAVAVGQDRGGSALRRVLREEVDPLRAVVVLEVHVAVVQRVLTEVVRSHGASRGGR